MKKRDMTENLSYQAPLVEVIDVSVERGFASSENPGNSPFFGPGYEL